MDKHINTLNKRIAKPIKRRPCPYCHSRHIYLAGLKMSVHRGKQQAMRCAECGHTYYNVKTKDGK